ncbi:MAG: TonB-dependent receptor [Alphaproteobacteria bacterium]|nr:TonB-dependent receptor [Alphaproteobacteria bacterium]
MRFSFWVGFCACLIFSFQALAADDSDELMKMDLKDLSSLKVTSVGKVEENAFDAAAAIYVITEEDIRNSGATSVPELLRTVPGVQVTRTDSSRWRISIRGFNEAFTNKLLVLIDGRSVYTPLFSGVYWDTQNVLLEDIARIEVIRGPGGTMWGANAVAGVINIIRKSASQTQGGFVKALYGNVERGALSGRYGGKIGDKGYFKTYAETFDRDESLRPDGTGLNNDWRVSTGGFRMDFDSINNNQITFQGDIYNGIKDGVSYLPDLPYPTINTVVRDEELSGANLLTRFNHHHEDDSTSQIQAYIDYTRRNNISLDQRIYTLDLDYQRSWIGNGKNDIVVGGGVRVIKDSLDETAYIRYSESNRTDEIFNVFAQDKISLIPDKLFATLGTKLEYNQYTNIELQPSAKISYKPKENQTVWTSLSRSVRTPSRTEQDVSVIVAGIPGGFATWNGNKDLDSEKLISLEGGYRIKPTKQTMLDFTTFVNWYDNLRTTEKGAGFLDTTTTFPPHINLPFTFENLGAAEVFGTELSGSWNVTKKLSLSGSYSYLRLNLHRDVGSNDTSFEKAEDQSAQNQFNLSSVYKFTPSLSMSNILSYVSELKGFSAPSYWRFDTSVNWNPIEHLDFSLVGQNLLDPSHPETSAPLYGEESEIRRSVYGKVTWHF